MLSDLITTWADYTTKVSGGNQMISGALSLWLMGVLTYMTRGVPKITKDFIVTNFTTSMTLNNGGYAEWQNMYHFMSWLQPKMNSRFSRTLSVRSGEYEAVLGIGYGRHLFFYEGRLFWIVLQKMDSAGSERQKDEIRLSTFGRSHAPFQKILKEFMPAKNEQNLQLRCINKEGGWDTYASFPKRPLCTVATSHKLKNRLLDQITHFKSNKDWFYSRGLPYKLSYILCGEPGTGKTSLIRSLASEFGMDICVINIHTLNDNILEKALATVPKNSIVLIEDFDSCAATRNRSKITTENIDGDDGGPLQAVFGFSLTLTGLLNALDGVNPLDDCILFMTTNHLDHVDPALYRKGRIDHVIEIGRVTPEDVREYAQMLYPEYNMNNLPFKSTLGCKLNEALLEGKDSPQKFLECLGVSTHNQQYMDAAE